MVKTKPLSFAALFIVTLLLIACGSTEDADRIVIGKGNFILLPEGSLQYQKAYVVQTTDVDGNAAPGTEVTIRLRNISYHKGSYTTIDTDGDAVDDAWGQVITISCAAEDINNNAVLDAGEDIDNDGRLDPTNPATVTAHPDLIPTLAGGNNKLVTDEFGFGYFTLTYPKSEALWVSIQISASADVSGTESTATFTQSLSAALSDFTDISISPPNQFSPYGSVADCSNPL